MLPTSFLLQCSATGISQQVSVSDWLLQVASHCPANQVTGIERVKRSPIKLVKRLQQLQRLALFLRQLHSAPPFVR